MNLRSWVCHRCYAEVPITDADLAAIREADRCHSLRPRFFCPACRDARHEQAVAERKAVQVAAANAHAPALAEALRGLLDSFEHADPNSRYTAMLIKDGFTALAAYDAAKGGK